MEMKPVRPIRDRYALRAGALWGDRKSTATIKLTLSQVRGVDLLLYALTNHTDVGSDEALFELAEGIRETLEMKCMNALASVPGGEIAKEFRTPDDILEDR